MKSRYLQTLWALPLLLAVFGTVHFISQVQGEDSLSLMHTESDVAIPAPVLSPEEIEITREYYDTGEVKSIFRFLEGVRHGPAFHFYPSGDLWKRETYVDGIKNGSFAVFYDGGGIMCKGIMVDGVPAGEVNHFNMDRSPKCVEVFSEGVLVNRTYQ